MLYSETTRLPGLTVEAAAALSVVDGAAAGCQYVVCHMPLSYGTLDGVSVIVTALGYVLGYV